MSNTDKAAAPKTFGWAALSTKQRETVELNTIHLRRLHELRTQQRHGK